MLAIHLEALGILIAIYDRAPDWIQRVIVGAMASAMAVMSGGYIATVFFDYDCDSILKLGHVIEHLAVLLYVFRIFINDQEKRCLPNSSPQSPRLLD